MSTRDDYRARHPRNLGPRDRVTGLPADTSPPLVFDATDVVVDDTAPLTVIATDHQLATDLTARFLTFHQEHPEVYRRLHALARQALAAGRTRGAIGMLYEVVRWETWLGGGDDYRLNNSYRSRYARLLMEADPDLADFFETRELHTT